MAATERGWLISQSFSEATAHHAATIFGPRARRETAAPATGGGGVDGATYPAGGGAPVPQPRVPLSATPALHLIAEPPPPHTHTPNRSAGQTGLLVKQACWSNRPPGQTGVPVKQESIGAQGTPGPWTRMTRSKTPAPVPFAPGGAPPLREDKGIRGPASSCPHPPLKTELVVGILLRTRTGRGAPPRRAGAP